MTKAQSAKMQAVLAALGPDAAILLANLLAGLNTKTKPAGKFGANSVKNPPYKAASEEATLEGKEARRMAFEQAVLKACEKAGYGPAVPNVDVLTYSKWEAKGFKVKTGEKSLRVKAKGMRGKGIPLFHKSQVEAVAMPMLTA